MCLVEFPGEDQDLELHVLQLRLIRLTGNRTLMGSDTNHRVTTAVGWAIGTLISVLNVVLIYLTVTG